MTVEIEAEIEIEIILTETGIDQILETEVANVTDLIEIKIKATKIIIGEEIETEMNQYLLDLKGMTAEIGSEEMTAVIGSGEMTVEIDFEEMKAEIGIDKIIENHTIDIDQIVEKEIMGVVDMIQGLQTENAVVMIEITMIEILTTGINVVIQERDLNLVFLATSVKFQDMVLDPAGN